ncbi:MAG TPA: hypothetical protein HA257_05115 [Candidatus Methanoperedenaceae archaeon]|nr:hypothetical protein [Candidatus Methanoperedenaceae archaeon]
MKPLPPTLRERRRYLAIEAYSEDAISQSDLAAEIWNAAGSLFGDKGSSECGLRIISFKGGHGIVRCSGDMVREARAVLATITAVKGTRVGIMVRGVAGTIRAATEKYILGDIELRAETGEKEIRCSGITGKAVRRVVDEIDILSDDQNAVQMMNRSSTRYIGATVFDITDRR